MVCMSTDKIPPEMHVVNQKNAACTRAMSKNSGTKTKKMLMAQTTVNCRLGLGLETLMRLESH